MAASWGAASGISAIAETALASSLTGGSALLLSSSQVALAHAVGGIAGGLAGGLTAGILSNAAGYNVNIGKAAGLGAVTGGLSKMGGLNSPVPSFASLKKTESKGIFSKRCGWFFTTELLC